MDCIIPGHNVRTFACAVGCLSRIGKEMYIEFDPLHGLIIRTLNDAKSAFASFSFEPNFFERCSSPIEVQTLNTSHHSRKKRKSQGGNTSTFTAHSNNDENDEKYMCRIPLRSVHSILRPRKGIVSLRIRSHRSTQKSYDSLSQDNLNGFITYSDTQDSTSSQPSNDDRRNDNPNFKYQLSFEFVISTNGILRVTRRLNVADCTSMKAIATRENSSQILSSPKTLLKLISPLKKTSELALHFQHSKRILSAASFHPSDTNISSVTSNMHIDHSSNALLKTETSMKCDEFEEYHWLDNRDVHDESTSTNRSIPLNVNEEVILVFGIKEAKAMLQFCSQANLNEEHYITFSFEWGGKPIIFDTESDYFSGELIMATLDHKLLVGYHVGEN